MNIINPYRFAGPSWQEELFNWQIIGSIAWVNENNAQSSAAWGQCYSANISGDELNRYYIGYTAPKDSSRRSIGVMNTIGYHADRTHLNRHILEYSNSVYAKTLATNHYVTAAYSANDRVTLSYNSSWEMYINEVLKYTWADGTMYTYLRFFIENALAFFPMTKIVR